MDILSKVLPFRSGNRMWALVLLQAYLLCMLLVLVGGFIINFIEGDTWTDLEARWARGLRNGKQNSYGDTALDECIWFVFMTMHGMTFGEFMPVSSTGHVIIMIVAGVGYWYLILMAAVVLLSQLPGQKTKNLLQVLADLVSACLPSYLVYGFVVLAAGSQLGPYFSKDPTGFNDHWTGMYMMWCVAHRTVFGDMWANTPESRWAVLIFTILSYIYPCYALALVAVRRPSTAQHQQLLAYMDQHPEARMGPGYIVPGEAASSSSSSRGGAREVQMS